MLQLNDVTEGGGDGHHTQPSAREKKRFGKHKITTLRIIAIPVHHCKTSHTQYCNAAVGKTGRPMIALRILATPVCCAWSSYARCITSARHCPLIHISSGRRACCFSRGPCQARSSCSYNSSPCRSCGKKWNWGQVMLMLLSPHCRAQQNPPRLVPRDTTLTLCYDTAMRR